MSWRARRPSGARPRYASSSLPSWPRGDP